MYFFYFVVVTVKLWRELFLSRTVVCAHVMREFARTCVCVRVRSCSFACVLEWVNECMCACVFVSSCMSLRVRVRTCVRESVRARVRACVQFQHQSMTVFKILTFETFYRDLIFAKVRPVRTKTTHIHTHTQTVTEKLLNMGDILQICLKANLVFVQVKLD